jgi:cytochrome P450
MRNDWSGHTFPHPPGRRPVVGDVLGTEVTKPLQSTMARGAGLGPIFELKIFDQKFVLVSGAELAAELADEKRFGKALPPALVALRQFAGDGLFTAYNDETNWALAHDLLRPAFTREAMRRYHPIMLAAARELFDTWDGRTSPVDVSPDMTRLTLETISRTAFSQDFGSFRRDEPHPFIPAMIAALSAGQRKGSLDSMPGSRLVARRIDQRNAHHQAYIDTMLDDIIATRRAAGAGGEQDLLGIMLDTPHPETGARLYDLNIRHHPHLPGRRARDDVRGPVVRTVPPHPRRRADGAGAGGGRPRPRTGSRRRADLRAGPDVPVPAPGAGRGAPAVADRPGLRPQPAGGHHLVDRARHASAGLGDRGAAHGAS